MRHSGRLLPLSQTGYLTGKTFHGQMHQLILRHKENKFYNIDTRTVGQFQFLEMAELDQVGKTTRGQEGTA